MMSSRLFNIEPIGMGIFNRGKLSNSNRTMLAKAIADVLGVTVAVPTQFAGIPVLNPQNAFFKNEGINELLDLLISAISFVNNNNNISEFNTAFDVAVSLKNNKWNITMALYWIDPKPL